MFPVEIGTVRLRLALRYVAAAAILLSPCAHAQDSSDDTMMPRGDRAEIAVTVRDTAGAAITTAGSVKLYHEGLLADESGLARGRAFFAPRTFGDYALVIDAAGYKPVQKDVNVSVAMRYEVEAVLRLDGATDATGVSAKPLLSPKAKEALDKSLKALSENKLSEAEKYVHEVVRLAPGHPDVLYVEGVLYLDQQKWAQAQTVLEKASQLDAASGRIFAALGMSLTDQGKYEQAIPPLEKSLQLDPGAWEAHWALGKAYYHHQQYEQALTSSQVALTKSNGKAPQIELLVAQALTAVGKYDDAAETLRNFLKHYGDRPEAPTARRWLGSLASNGKIRPN